MKLSSAPFAEKRFAEIHGRKMGYLDEGEGDAIVFSHGNPTSSYLWRNIMPACRGFGRLIACDLIGQGDSDKLPDSGPDRYSYAEQRSFIHALWDALDLGDNIIFVLHDWGSALGFDYAHQHENRIQGIAYMESILLTRDWSEVNDQHRDIFQKLRSPAGEDMVLCDNIFVEQLCLDEMRRPLADEEKAEYRRPFIRPGEDRRPTLSWPRQIPIGGEPAAVAETVDTYATWMASNDLPKLYIHAEPGAQDSSERQVALCRSFKNQREIGVEAGHFVPEDAPQIVAPAIAEFVRLLRGDR